MSKPKVKYGRPHARERARWAKEVDAGGVRCRRCSGWIAPGSAWDLGHDDLNPNGPKHPEHRACNRATAGRGVAEVVAARAGRAGVPEPEPAERADAVERPFPDDGNL